MNFENNKYFRKYIENTTTHGVVRIFSGNSFIRRLFWLFIVLGTASGCLYNIIDRIRFLASAPTATTLSLQREDNLTFPAVTICNLNPFQRDVVNSIHPSFSDILRNVYYTDPLSSEENFACYYHVNDFLEHNNLTELILTDLWYMARSRKEDFIRGCFFSGMRCSHKDFEQVITDTGICYTFNMKSSRRATSAGVRAGLYVALDINQSQYVSSSSFDAGVRVAVHTKDTPPRPEDVGVGVPPGTNAFIGIRKRETIDNTRRTCQVELNSYNFTFITHPYSIAACSYDCLLRRIAENCECVIKPSLTGEFTSLPNCSVGNICCILKKQQLTVDCDCPEACNTTDFNIFNSYSAFPGEYAESEIEDLLDITDSRYNLVSINVYYETLKVETQTTNDAYDMVGLLSDIGGNLGLFLGMSVISIMEFTTWVIDEVKNRLFRGKLTERKLYRFCSCMCGKVESTDDESHTNSDSKDKQSERKLHALTL